VLKCAFTSGAREGVGKREDEMSQVNVNPPAGGDGSGDRTAAAGINLITVIIVLIVVLVILWWLFFAGPLAGMFGGGTSTTNVNVNVPAPTVAPKK